MSNIVALNETEKSWADVVRESRGTTYEEKAININVSDVFEEVVDKFSKLELIEVKELNAKIRNLTTQGDIYGAHTTLKNMKHPDARSYQPILTAYEKMNKMEKVEGLVAEMLERGIRLNVNNYFSRMMSCVRRGLHQKSCSLFEQMCKEKIDPNLVSYNIYIQSLCKIGNEVQAWKLFQSMKKEKSVVPDLVTYRTIMSGLCKTRKVVKALKIFHSMKKELKVAPDIFECNIIINGFCINQDLNGALQFLNEMKDNKIFPNKITFSTLIKGYCLEGDVKGAYSIIKKTRQEGIKLDSTAYAILIKSHFEANEFDEALKLFEEMIDDGVSPHATTYTVLLTGCCLAKKLKSALDFFEKMKKDKIELDSIIYSTLINSCFESDKKDQAFDLIEEMKSKDIRADGAFYHLVVDWMMQFEDKEKTDLYFKECPKDFLPTIENNTVDAHKFTAGFIFRFLYDIFQQIQAGERDSIIVIVGKGLHRKRKLIQEKYCMRLGINYFLQKEFPQLQMVSINNNLGRVAIRKK